MKNLELYENYENYPQIIKGSNRIVIVYKNFIRKIPIDSEAIYQNKEEFEIWDKTNSPILCKCDLKDDFFIDMEKIEVDISKNRPGIIDPKEIKLPDPIIKLLKKHPNLEYGTINGKVKIYDYADYADNYDIELFINDIKECDELLRKEKYY